MLQTVAMIQIRRTILWLLILLVGVAAIVPDSAEEIIAKATQAANGGWAGPDLDDLTEDATPAAQTDLFPHIFLSQTHHWLDFSEVLPSTAPRLIPLRL
jgi:hypothetical protein